MSLPDEILALDVLTLRAHTEAAGVAFDVARQREAIVASLARNECVWLRRDGQLQAYAMLQVQPAGCGFVLGFNIHPARRNAGTVRALLRQVLAWAQRNGIEFLRSNVYKTNALSLAFHRRLGFSVTRENALGVELSAPLAKLIAHSQLRDLASSLSD